MSPHSPRAKWMSEWQIPQNLMSMRTSLAPSARRSICSGARSAVGDPAPTARAVVVVVLLVAVTVRHYGRASRGLKGPCERGTGRAPRTGWASPYIGGMGRSLKPSEFLTARRASVTPADVGIPVHGRRQVQGLRREEVASLAGVSVEYYKRLERGQATSPSESVLGALADALRLNTIERAHLFDLARAAGPACPTPRPEPVRLRPVAQRVLDTIGSPVVVNNARGDYIG